MWFFLVLIRVRIIRDAPGRCASSDAGSRRMADIGCGDTVAAGPSLCLDDCMDTDSLADNCYALREEELHGCKNRDEAPDQCKDPTPDVGRNVPCAKASTLASEFIVSGTFWVDISWRATLVLQFFTGKCSRSRMASVMVAGRPRSCLCLSLLTFLGKVMCKEKSWLSERFWICRLDT